MLDWKVAREGEILKVLSDGNETLREKEKERERERERDEKDEDEYQLN